jgi:hypothetical protein
MKTVTSASSQQGLQRHYPTQPENINAASISEQQESSGWQFPALP